MKRHDNTRSQLSAERNNQYGDWFTNIIPTIYKYVFNEIDITIIIPKSKANEKV